MCFLSHFVTYSCIHSHAYSYTEHTFTKYLCASITRKLAEGLGHRRRHAPGCRVFPPPDPSTCMQPQWMKCFRIRERPTRRLCSASHPSHLSKDFPPTIYPLFSCFINASFSNSPLLPGSKHALPSSVLKNSLPAAYPATSPFLCSLVSALTSSFPSKQASADPLKSPQPPS